VTKPVCSRCQSARVAADWGSRFMVGGAVCCLMAGLGLVVVAHLRPEFAPFPTDLRERGEVGSFLDGVLGGFWGLAMALAALATLRQQGRALRQAVWDAQERRAMDTAKERAGFFLSSIREVVEVVRRVESQPDADLLGTLRASALNLAVMRANFQQALLFHDPRQEHERVLLARVVGAHVRDLLVRSAEAVFGTGSTDECGPTAEQLVRLAARDRRVATALEHLQAVARDAPTSV
jgi:hypothetical protein